MRTIILDTETEAIADLAVTTPRFVTGGCLIDGTYCTFASPAGAASFFDEPDTVVVGHNLSFDMRVLGAKPGRAQLFDTMIADLLVRLAANDCFDDKGIPRFRSLDKVSGEPDWSGDITCSFKVGQPITPEQAEYLHHDVTATARCYERLRERVPGGMGEVDRQVRAHWALGHLTQRGVNVNLAAIASARHEYRKQMDEAAKVLAPAGMYRPAKVGKKGGQYPESCNVKLFRKHVESLGGERLTAKGALAIDHDSLLKYQDDPIVRAWIDFKDCQKIVGTFLDSWTTESLHPKYNLMARTGRVSCAKPNLQQVPSRGAKAAVKAIFVPPPGCVFYELDYIQLELACLAYITQGRMLKLINSGTDIHRALAAVCFGKAEADVTKAERQLAKCLSFGLPGGMGVEKFRHFLRTNGVADPGAQAVKLLIRRWHEFFPEMRRWLYEDSHEYAPIWSGRFRKAQVDAVIWDSAWEMAAFLAAKEDVPAEIRTAVARHWGSQDVECWMTRRTVVVDRGRTRHPVSYSEFRNTKFQGLAANLAKEALVNLVLAEEQLKCQVHLFIHDSFLISCADNRETARSVARIMLNAAKAWLPGVRAGVEITGPGKTWLEAKGGEGEKLYVDTSN